MARTVEAIFSQIMGYISGNPYLKDTLVSTSKRAIYRNMAYVTAVNINLLEQLIDAFTVEVETVARTASGGTPEWIRARMFEFQYSDDEPQIVQLINLATSYPVVDESLRIISRCSVTSNVANSVMIKVAKNDPAEPLSNLELAAAQGYINIAGTAGITYKVISSEPDRLFVEADIYFSGLYSATIMANVRAAVDRYLAMLPSAAGYDNRSLDGAVSVTRLEDAIQAVPGVTDVVLRNVKARAFQADLADASYLVQHNTEVARKWNTIAGYIIAEDTPGSTLSDTLNFIPE